MAATFTKLERKLRSSIVGMGADHTQIHEPSKWSSQQVVEHLTLTYSATCRALEVRIAKERPTQALPTMRQHCMRTLVVNLGCFPPGVKAPLAVSPQTGSAALPGLELAELFSEHLWRLDIALKQVTMQFGGGTRSASHIILGPLSPVEWRGFHVIHGLRHIAQIEAIKRSPSYIRANRPPEDPLHRR